jgi:transcriptional regulator with XRE-family HTH domain
MKKHTRYRKFGLLVYKRRQEMHLTQEQLAETLGISVQQVRNYESGRCRPSVSKLLDISRKMSVTVECLMLSVSEKV